MRVFTLVFSLAVFVNSIVSRSIIKKPDDEENYIFKENAVETLDPAHLKIESRKLHVPPLLELKSIFEKALSKNFADVTVEIVECPDLTEAPFALAASGLGGNPTLAEIGGEEYQWPSLQKDKLYDIKTLARHLGHGDKSFVTGAGAGPWPYLNTNIEMMMNVVLDTPMSSATTRIASVNPSDGSCVFQILPGNETRFAFTASLFLSKSKPGKVIKVSVKKRIGDDNFISTMQKALSKEYSNDLVGLGGTFLVKKGKVQQSAMKQFFEKPANTPEEKNSHIQLYEMSAPLVAVGTFVSAETDLHLRVAHWHSYSSIEGGHYIEDTTPDIVEYLGYFTPARIFYRVDQPPKGEKIGIH
ncbi:ester hydrolase C11orf54 homolog [Belonocnema kinseyi]|uniref:ester hydrolase C11orf54 homolog n=1 Tax=Belonocnema kinseyi TaxID=2817044 RepID=UPI00143DEB3C|nr:ester hydrolase C11orf54 homolog [Belonocnema kinseyi]